jgi:hypothetical protein
MSNSPSNNDNRNAPGTGNASNPSPDNQLKPQANQLIDEKGEKYLREVASIEDLPDAQDDVEKEQDEKE